MVTDRSEMVSLFRLAEATSIVSGILAMRASRMLVTVAFQRDSDPSIEVSVQSRSLCCWSVEVSY